jgi:hypothetical protein
MNADSQSNSSRLRQRNSVKGADGGAGNSGGAGPAGGNVNLEPSDNGEEESEEADVIVF